MELQVAHADIIKVLDIVNALRVRVERGHRLRERLRPVESVRMIADEFLAFGRCECQCYLCRFLHVFRRNLEVIRERLVRSDIRSLLIQDLALTARNCDFYGRTDLRHIRCNVDGP